MAPDNRSSGRWGGAWDGDTWSWGVWAPDAVAAAIVLNGTEMALTRRDDGFWVATAAAKPGDQYHVEIDGRRLTDPASRLQAGDVHAPSVVMGRSDYQWQTPWHGRDWAEAVIYEMHIGTFTPEGTLAAAATKLAGLADLGITAIELMPIGQWPGDRGWGYDGVLPYALHPAYGRPDDLRRFVDHAQSVGLMVILDMVMNHFGPEGAGMHHIAPRFFDTERQTPWGAAIDFSQPAVREYWLQCAEYWVAKYRLDGVRLDAVHQISGPGADGFMHDLAQRVRAADPARTIHLITEDERNDPHLCETGYDAQWNDDFHHAVHCQLTGEGGSFLASFAKDPMADLALALQRGQVEEGQPRHGQDRPRGKPSGHLPPTAFVNFLQSHDHTGNRPGGERLLALAAEDGVRTAYALLLTAPYVPMIFMGEERGATTPFLFFADFDGELADQIREGRANDFAGLGNAAADIPDALSAEAFVRSKLTWHDDPNARNWRDLTRRALAFRADRVVPLLKSGRSAPAHVTRHGASSLAAEWHFHAGTMNLWLSMGDVAQDWSPPPDQAFHLGRLGQDPFAISVTTRPR